MLHCTEDQVASCSTMASFRLHSGDTDFNSRVDALFSSLQTAAKELEPQLKREHEEEPEEEEEEEGVVGGGKRHCFSRPQGRPPQWRGRGGRRGRGGGFGPRNSTPDYIKNPQNWTRYSMRDTQVLNDSENKQEGLRLLADLSTRTNRNQTEENQPMDLDEDNQPKIIFKKPTVPTLPKVEDQKLMEQEEEEEEEAEEPHHSVLGGSRKFHKPEYVVGKAKPKLKEKVASKVTKAIEDEREAGRKEVKLSYLMFEEED